MMKNKKMILLTSLLTLFPIVVGLILWNQLPDQIATHFNSEGIADGYSSKLFAVIGLPMLILVIHLFCIFMTSQDPKNKDISNKINSLILWICPLVSLFATLAVYPYALGYDLNSSFLTSVLLGVMFIVIGNYLPKCRQNYTIGIKLPWTLSDEDNWNKTHRLAGKLWFIGGLIILLNAFVHLAGMWIMLGMLLIMTLIPTVYSYLYYRKKDHVS